MDSLQKKLEGILLKLDYRKETEFQGIKFELALLNISDEQKMNAIPVGDDTEDSLLYFNEMRKAILSHAIRKIDGEDIPDVVVAPDGEGTVTKERSIYLREFLDKLPTAITEHLFDVYVDLKEEAEAKFGENVKYEWFKTPEMREKENEERMKELRAQASAGQESEKQQEPVEEQEVPQDTDEINLRPVKDDRDEEQKA